MIKSKLATLLFLYTALISNAKTENTINSLESFLQGLNSLEVDFTQILMNENGRELERASGVLYLKKPGKFYWNYQHPYSQKIITNGKILWIFDEDLEQVTIKNIDNSISKTPAGIILADEINRTPPKTQAALLEAMQEQQVTIGGKRHLLGHPFFVLATQNPIEQEGTYPLPEAQLDRFMFNILVDYPTEDEELRIVQQTTTANRPQIKEVLTGPQIIELQEIVRKIPIADHVIQIGRASCRERV